MVGPTHRWSLVFPFTSPSNGETSSTEETKFYLLHVLLHSTPTWDLFCRSTRSFGIASRPKKGFSEDGDYGEAAPPPGSDD